MICARKGACQAWQAPLAGTGGSRPRSLPARGVPCQNGIPCQSPVEDICRKLGISQATFFRWKQRFGQTGTAELRRLRQLAEENKKLKQLVADLRLDKKMLQDVLAKKL
jgi:putative transposase